MTPQEWQQRIDATALAMLHLSPEDRERCLCDAFNHTMPNATEIPPVTIWYVSEVFRRIAQFELMAGNA